jgi:hypothetical protein
MKRFHFFLLLVLAVFTLSGCYSEEDEDYYAIVKMYNESNYPVHLFATGEDFNSENKVEPGQARSTNFLVSEYLEGKIVLLTPFDVTITAGSGGQVIAKTTITINTDETYRVRFNGVNFN